MAPRRATPDLPADVALGVVTLDAAALAAADQSTTDDWVRVAPRGEVITRDGRRYTFEPERLVARFAADGIDVPVDIDHAISRKPMFGERADAVGWVRALEARADGLWARVELLDAGRAVLTARTHRFVSPTFHHTESGLATWLHSVALVAAPALAMAAIAAAGPASPQHTETSSMLKAIAKALGLAETADEAACLAAITTLGTRIDKAVHDQALATLAATNEQLAAAQAQLAARDKADHEAKVAALLAAALTAKKIVPAQRDQYAALCATAEGLAQVTALLAATPAGLQPSGLDTQPVPVPGTDIGSADTLLAKAHALINTAAKAGRTLSLADAIVQANGGIE